MLRLSRSQILAGAAALGAFPALRLPARAADVVFKLSHPYPPDYYISPRLVQMADAVKAQTQGQLQIQIFPNSILGSSTSVFAQLRSGAIQLYCTTTYQGIVPNAQIDNVGFAFTSDQQAIDAFNGPLGAYMRQEFAQKGIYVFEKVMSGGFREVANSLKPVTVAEDFRGLKLRVPPSATIVELFKALGASPATVDASEMYTACQTHLVDGVELPLTGIEAYKIYEVTKYISITNHIWSSTWLFANGDAWAALPADLKTVLANNAARCSSLVNSDLTAQNATLIDKLKQQGLAINTADTNSMRARLGGYYAWCQAQFGSTAWNLLQSAVGKLS